MTSTLLPNPWDLKYFQEVAATGNISRAAERLGVGQPAISLAIKRLEEILTADLFYRRSKGITLTPAGQRLLKSSNQLMMDWEHVISDTKQSRSEMSGRFTLGCHPSVAMYSISKPLKTIYETHPGIEVNLKHGLSRVICEQVISGEIDFAIVINPIQHPDLVIHKLAQDDVCFWKAKNGLADVIIYDPALGQSQSLLKKIGKKKPFTRSITSENLEVITRMAQSGLGVGIIPSRVVQNLAPSLVKISEFPSYSDQITFVYRKDLFKTTSSKYIIDLFKTVKI